MPRKRSNLPLSKKNRFLGIILILFGMAVIAVVVYFIPPVHDWLSWRLLQLRADIFYFFNPPDEISFSPEQQAEMERIVNITQTAMAPSPTLTLHPSLTPTNYISPKPTQTPTQTPSPTSLPRSKRLEGVIHEWEDFNNCGPATLSMALSYWGWEGDQHVTGDWLKPNSRDRNVMPYEMVDYVNHMTELSVITRSGGNLELIKQFIAAGFPAIVEKGFEEEVPQKAWMGHYGVITAFDDMKEIFIVQDPYSGPNYANSYEKIARHWRSFNYLFMIIYPPHREAEVFSILGPNVDEIYNYQQAAQKALDEIEILAGRELFFAWFNYGTNLANLGDYYASAQAYDQAYEIYADLASKPWRITWYQTGPYFAYYYTGRYQDVIDLANITLSYSSVQPAIEESWVWRGRAKSALGDIEGAIEDFRTALEWHPGWWVAEQELRNLDVEP